MSTVHNNHRHLNYSGPLLLLFIMLHLSTLRDLFFLQFHTAKVAQADGSPLVLKQSCRRFLRNFPQWCQIHCEMVSVLRLTFTPQKQIPLLLKTMEVLVSWCQAAFFCCFVLGFLFFPFCETGLNICALGVPRSGFVNELNGWCFASALLWRRQLGYKNCEETLRA